MGTRHLIMAVKDGKTRLAQYGQWDGYPSGQGVDVLKFVSSKQRRAKLSKVLDKVQFLTQADLDRGYEKVGVQKGAFGLNKKQSDSFNRMFPLLSRDHGANILTLLLSADKPQLVNSEEFAGDSLFCEWAYVIDFDKQTFEVYKGFNTSEPLDKHDRFFGTKNDNKKYYPIKMIADWKFDEIPSRAKFFEYLADC